MFLKISSSQGVWGTEKLFQDVFVTNHLLINPYLILFKWTSPKRCSWKIIVCENISSVFLQLYLCHRYFSNPLKTLVKHLLLLEKISITATEWLTSLPGIASVRCESMSQFLKKMKLADIGRPYEFYQKYLIIKCFKYFQPKN